MNRNRTFAAIKGLLAFVVFAKTVPFQAQNVETILQAPILAVNGGISASQIATFTPGDTTGLNPYALYLSGNLNFSLLGEVNLPLSFAYTNQQLSKSVSLPFNRFSIAPSYKWVKVYAGYTSMQFSPYSLAGHELFGGGVELTPDNGFKISALYGRLKKSSDGEDGTDPAYRRMGGGFKIEYQKEKFNVGVNLFKAQDIPSSIPPDSVATSPQDNLTGSVNATVSLLEKLRFSGEYGFSALNRNIYPQGDRFSLLAKDGDLALYHAVKTQLTYTSDLGAIGATYERVAPNYMTLGAYYMTNDFENVTANFATTVKKISIALDGGYQRNNLDKQKTNTTSRIIYAGNISSNVTEKFNISANFSNVQSYLYINDVYSQVTQTNEFQNLDTLNVTQLNYSASLNSSYLLQSTKEKRQSANLNVMYQKSAEAQQYSRFSGNDIYNASLSYQFSLLPLKLNASTSVNYNYNRMPDNLYTQAMTYSLSVQKTFFDELKSALTGTYSRMSNQSGKLSNVLNLRLSESYVFAQRH
ncbi:MAG: outer membrane beta-barrel family protein, partial [Bacteroidales bacterium]|nr:outer membrane beta-barrel family protein [Bacteroidales bacterium]